uniref:c-type cytochrome n=1 Tax=Thaumasiovibrio occultus TaxID=1891184 RepID=UPI000B34BFE8|nr:cytochrome c5 family protein [Thaumasiovibrio occultus]
MDKISRLLLTGMVAAWITIPSAIASDMSDDAITARIKPIGSVYLVGDAPVIEIATGPLSGEQVYTQFCATCHATGLAGAPAVDDSAAWQPRIAQGNDVLADHAINGFNAMPARGSCMNCSDEEIIAAIDHMIAGL